MHRLSPISWKNFVKKMLKLGFEGPYEGGKHPYMVKGDTVVTIPNPHRGDINVDLLKRILSQAEITRDKWLSA